MVFARRHRSFAYRLAVLGALLCYVVAGLGALPTPSAVARWLGRFRSQTERFPCEESSCGCSTARECWTSCCCLSQTERLVWATRNGVNPPDDLTFSTDAWAAAFRVTGRSEIACSLCVAKVRAELRAGRCWHTEAASGCHDSCCRSAPAPAGLCYSPLKCKSIDLMMLVSLPSQVGADTTRLLIDGRDSIVAVLVVDDESAASRCIDADSPPPRTTLPGPMTRS